MTKEQQDKLQELAKEHCGEGFYHSQMDFIFGATHILEHPEQWFEIVDCEYCNGLKYFESSHHDIINCGKCNGEGKIIKLKS